MAISAEHGRIAGLSRRQTIRFTKSAWAVLVLNFLVILWGAYVRASGSGAGCGNHWPLCNGEIVPQTPAAAMIIEFTHRVTSGLALLSVLALCVWSFRVFPAGSRVRAASAFSLSFIFMEALLGAGLVLFQYVARNASAGRAIYLSAHLANTQILLACLTGTAWLAGRPLKSNLFSKKNAMVQACLASLLIVSISGAIAALGDTLFPSTSFAEGFRQELSGTAHILLRLRILHPALAVAAGLFVIFAAIPARRHPLLSVRKLGLLVLILLFLQMAAGAINVFLLAPIWMQLTHLLLANLLWIAAVALLLETGAGTPAEAR